MVKLTNKIIKPVRSNTLVKSIPSNERLLTAHVKTTTTVGGLRGTRDKNRVPNIGVAIRMRQIL